MLKTETTLTGKVESSVDKALPLNWSKFRRRKDVDNQLTVMNEKEGTSEVVATLTDSLPDRKPVAISLAMFGTQMLDMNGIVHQKVKLLAMPNVS